MRTESTRFLEILTFFENNVVKLLNYFQRKTPQYKRRFARFLSKNGVYTEGSLFQELG